MNLTITYKGGYVGFLGKMILFLYYMISSIARLFAWLLYFTPSLGLMNTLYHRKFSLLKVQEQQFDDDFPPPSMAVFDLYQNGTITFGEKWKQYHEKQFYTFPPEIVVAGVPILLFVHLLISMLLQEKIYHKGANDCGMAKNILEGIRTWVCIPLHLDWELIHRSSNFELDIPECWRRSKKLLLSYNVLFLIEHMIMLVPLAVLKWEIDQRNARMAGDFPLVAEEQTSTFMVNALFFSGLVCFLMLPIVSLALAYLYFIQKHPWSRVLVASLAEQNEHQEGESGIEMAEMRPSNQKLTDSSESASKV